MNKNYLKFAMLMGGEADKFYLETDEPIDANRLPNRRPSRL